MKSPIFGKEKLLYFPQKSGIVPIFKKSPSSYISYFCHHAPWITMQYNNVILRQLPDARWSFSFDLIRHTVKRTLFNIVSLYSTSSLTPDGCLISD